MSEKNKLKINDRRHWAKTEKDAENDGKEPDLERIPTFVNKLKKETEESDQKLKEYIGAYKEKMAENDEFRVRLQKDVERRVETKIAEFIQEILPSLDNLELASESALKTKDIDKLIEGIGMIKLRTMQVFDKFGMKEIDCMGKEFDPKVAEALQAADVDEKEKDNMVIQIVQPGYMLNDMLVRPARVIVGKYTGEK